MRPMMLCQAIGAANPEDPPKRIANLKASWVRRPPWPGTLQCKAGNGRDGGGHSGRLVGWSAGASEEEVRLRVTRSTMPGWFSKETRQTPKVREPAGAWSGTNGEDHYEQRTHRRGPSLYSGVRVRVHSHAVPVRCRAPSRSSHRRARCGWTTRYSSTSSVGAWVGEVSRWSRMLASSRIWAD